MQEVSMMLCIFALVGLGRWRTETTHSADGETLLILFLFWYLLNYMGLWVDVRHSLKIMVSY